ncbi:formate-dependent phosphoribosylglycinamide formyltransferase [Tsukamurella ocularis]|uniref:formate-dependent phosphoribosylglycinamide formyltransferase n=1 Tax=Tsukamurella ocularis TaxID=1970234 RepID=UPI002168FF2F|nr:formate-dependent phosphoribosylglycinamide formyltransferase [Tsukamurella ocularis]MCS3781320.1 phosphoribosylglycinamide formyltransferase 2 [Tsukamurella ocularis]MCS3787691.1 phosphoribosylglycinamide formyltransferase 2 [Tsukamurella ocularis]MCS3850986.1 phosphoribosylglycinamide formyltransferase 2 [Tsukamurella ocularis]
MTNLSETGGNPRIGTALTPGATKALMLGSGELGKEVVIAFQRLGVETIAVDRYANAPAMQVAHRSHVIDMTDAAEVRRVIEAEKPDFVVPEIEALATEALVAVDEEGLAEVIPTARAVALTMNREGIRKLAAEELGLPCSPYAFASSLDEVRAASREVGFPCVIKPVMSSSGKGQSVVRSVEELDGAWTYAVEGGRVRNERVIVEGFVDFDYEITLLTVRVYDAERGKVVTRFCEPIGHRQSDGDYVESWQPQAMSQAAYDAATSVAGRITTALGDGGTGGRGVFGVELFVKGDDVYFSEVSPRPHDTGLVTLGSQRLSEFELHARAILGLPVDTSLMSPAASAVIYGTKDSSSVAFDSVSRALDVPESDLRLFGKPEGYAKRRLGVAVATADTVEVARANAAEAAGRVVVVDSTDPFQQGAPETTAVPIQRPQPPLDDPSTRAMPVQRPVHPAPTQQPPAQQIPVQKAPQQPTPPPAPPTAASPVVPPAPPTAASPVVPPQQPSSRVAPPQAGPAEPIAPTSMHPVAARRPAPPRPIQPAPRPPTGETATRPKPPTVPEIEEYDHNPPTSMGLPPQRPQD